MPGFNFQNTGDTLLRPPNVRGPRSAGLLRDSLGQSRLLENDLAVSQERFETGVDSTEQERNRLRSGVGSSVQQRFPNVRGRRSFANNLEQTIRRGKARQGILNRGERAISNQQLKDRVSIARQRIQRKGVLEGALANASRLREGVASNAQRAKDQVGSALGGALGSIAGGLASGFGDKLFNSSTEIPIETDQGTSFSDFLNIDTRQPPPIDFFDAGGESFV